MEDRLVRCEQHGGSEWCVVDWKGRHTDYGDLDLRRKEAVLMYLHHSARPIMQAGQPEDIRALCDLLVGGVSSLASRGQHESSRWEDGVRALARLYSRIYGFMIVGFIVMTLLVTTILIQSNVVVAGWQTGSIWLAIAVIGVLWLHRWLESEWRPPFVDNALLEKARLE